MTRGMSATSGSVEDFYDRRPGLARVGRVEQVVLVFTSLGDSHLFEISPSFDGRILKMNKVKITVAWKIDTVSEHPGRQGAAL